MTQEDAAGVAIDESGCTPLGKCLLEAMRELLLNDRAECQLLLLLRDDSTGLLLSSTGGKALGENSPLTEFISWIMSPPWNSIQSCEKMLWAHATLTAMDTVGWSEAAVVWSSENQQKWTLISSNNHAAHAIQSLMVGLGQSNNKQRLAEEECCKELHVKIDRLLWLGKRKWRRVIRTQFGARALWGRGAIDCKPTLAEYPSNGATDKPIYWKLDSTESEANCRMRRRLKRNYEGSDHSDAAFAKHLIKSMVPPPQQTVETESTEGVEAMLRRINSLKVRPSSLSEDATVQEYDDEDEMDAKEVEEAGDDSDEDYTTTTSNNSSSSDHDKQWAGLEASSSGDGHVHRPEGVYQIERAGSRDKSGRRIFVCDDCEMIAASMRGGCKGKLEMTHRNILFFPSSGQEGAEGGHKDHMWNLADLYQIHGRRFLLQSSAIELFFEHFAVFINFTSFELAMDHRRNFYKKLIALRPPNLKLHYLNNPAKAFASSGIQQKWINRQISNFEYLMQLNTFAGRTYNDLTQYPVFPWILADYTSPQLDLTKESTFRNLSKPMGAQTAECEKFFRERYRSWQDPEIPKFHYGSHYSNAGFVLFYLVRLEHYTSHALVLQDGHFDCPDRFFHHLGEVWKNCSSRFEDVKELIPEFFYLPEFLVNHNRLDLGTKQDGINVNDVILPTWAANADDFVRQHRLALESDYVSAHLHEWVDLIFGEKQRGPKAEQACNVFFYLTYEGNVDLRTVADPVMRRANEAQIANFGQTPCQLFTCSHPPRRFDLPLPPAIHIPDSLTFFHMKSPKDGLVRVSHIICGVSGVVISIHSDGKGKIHSWKPGVPDGHGLPFVFEYDSVRIGSTASAKQLLTQLIKRTDAEFTAIATAPLTASELNGSHKYGLLHKPHRLLSCGYLDRTLRIDPLTRDARNKSMIIRTDHQDIVTCVGVGETGSVFVTGSRDSTLRIWNLKFKRKVFVLPESSSHVLYGHSAPIVAVAVSEDQDAIVSSSEDSTLCFWTLRKAKFVHSVKVTSVPSLMCFASSGFVVMYMHTVGMLQVVNINGRLITEAPAKDRIYTMILTADGNNVITGGESGVVVVRDIFTLEMKGILNALQCAVTSLQLDESNNHLIAGLEDGSVHIATDPSRQANIVNKILTEQFDVF